jgi:hypothetical protein
MTKRTPRQSDLDSQFTSDLQEFQSGWAYETPLAASYHQIQVTPFQVACPSATVFSTDRAIWY